MPRWNKTSADRAFAADWFAGRSLPAPASCCSCCSLLVAPPAPRPRRATVTKTIRFASARRRSSRGGSRKRAEVPGGDRERVGARSGPLRPRGYRLRLERYAEAEKMFRKAILERTESRSGGLYPEANAALGLILYRLGQPGRPPRVRRRAGPEERALGSQLRHGAHADRREAVRRGARTSKRARPQGRLRGRGPLPLRASVRRGSPRATSPGPRRRRWSRWTSTRASPSTPPGRRHLHGEEDAGPRHPRLREGALHAGGGADAAGPQILGQLYEGEKRYTDALRHYGGARDRLDLRPGLQERGPAVQPRDPAAGRRPVLPEVHPARPEDAEGQVGLAEAFYRLGSLPQGPGGGREGLRLDSTDVRVRLTLARATFLTNDLARSERLYATVPDTVRTSRGLGQAGADRHRPEEAATADSCFGRAGQGLDPGRRLSPRGKIYLGRRSPTPPPSTSRSRSDCRPNSAPTKINLGIAYLQLKRPQDAARTLREAVALSPDFAPAHVYLGQALVIGRLALGGPWSSTSGPWSSTRRTARPTAAPRTCT